MCGAAETPERPPVLDMSNVRSRIRTNVGTTNIQPQISPVKVTSRSALSRQSTRRQSTNRSRASSRTSNFYKLTPRRLASVKRREGRAEVKRIFVKLEANAQGKYVKLRDWFRSYDGDHDGFIDQKEFKQVFVDNQLESELGIDANEIFDYFDKDRSGQIELHEFTHAALALRNEGASQASTSPASTARILAPLSAAKHRVSISLGV